MKDTGAQKDAAAAGYAKMREPYRTGALISLLRLRWFINLRWGMVVMAMGALVLERLVLGAPPRPRALVVTLLLVAGANVVWMAVSRIQRIRSLATDGNEEQTIRAALVFANAQVAIDLLLLTAILRYAGGVESPMALFYLFHMAIGSLLLKTWQALLQGMWAVTLYAALGVGELAGQIYPHYPFLTMVERAGWYEVPEYVAVAIGTLACGVFGTLYFTLRIASRLDERERQLREAHGALHQSQEAISELQSRRSRFMQTAAHQLKSPLAGIHTLAGLIRDEVVPEQTIREISAKIMRRCREGIAQVTELLTLARVQEADPRRHAATAQDVGAIAAEVCQQYEAQAREKNVTLSYGAVSGADLQVYVARTDLADCVGNLVDNAVKYTPDSGSVTVEVGRCSNEELSERSPAAGGRVPSGGDWVYVTVKDTGIGMDSNGFVSGEDSVTGWVFDAFRRGNRALESGIAGTGLGLSIVREVVEQGGGQIRVHSQPGQGSTFQVMFPARPVGGEDAGLAVRSTRSSSVVIDRDAPDQPGETAPPSGGAG